MQVAGSVSISGILDRVLQRRRWSHIVETRRDGVFRAICGVALLAKGVDHSLRNASCSSSRETAVAAPRDLIRGSTGIINSALLIHFFAVWREAARKPAFSCQKTNDRP